jgi:HAD superfamily hydrolase (TIGR01459 family)
LKSLSGRFPVWLCDVWGVVHNGYEPIASTAKVLQMHRAAGGIVILVTNSPRSADGVEKQLKEIGVGQECWDAIVTSGDVTRTLMLEKGGRKLFHLGPDRDLSLFADLDVERVHLDHAKSIICTGLFREFEEKPEDYLPQLRELKSRNLPMICANPDKVVRKGDNFIYCAGSLAEIYASLGGTVYMAGKPYAPIYDLAMRKASEIRRRPVVKSEVLAIGDGLETDVKGAADYGVQVVLLAGGINGDGADTAKLQAVAMTLAPNAKLAMVTRELDWSDVSNDS